MAYNKITYFGATLIDLTGDSVTADKLEKDITAHNKAGEAITGTAARKLVFTDVPVTVDKFAADTTYEDYPYRAAVALSGVTAAYTPYVIFSEADAETGTFSRIASSYAGGVYIYASEAPTEAITIDDIICIEE